MLGAQIRLWLPSCGHSGEMQRCRLWENVSTSPDQVVSDVETYLSWFSSCVRSVLTGLMADMVRRGGMLKVGSRNVDVRPFVGGNAITNGKSRAPVKLTASANRG